MHLVGHPLPDSIAGQHNELVLLLVQVVHVVVRHAGHPDLLGEQISKRPADGQAGLPIVAKVNSIRPPSCAVVVNHHPINLRGRQGNKNHTCKDHSELSLHAEGAA